MSPSTFAQRIVRWQRRHGRHHLPWQQTRDPYRVWLSEIMLQQTQVATVLRYYEPFLRRFADVAALAAAPLDEVLGLWSGLGYYGRARNLHRCARVVVQDWGGVFPATSADLARLPGIGASTAAAIAAFCFGERVAILDGNVKRVLSRAFAFDADLSELRRLRELWALAQSLLPEGGIESYSQGMMDLGATLCVPRNPKCRACPVGTGCVAATTGTQDHYPVESKRLRRSSREHVWLLLVWRDRVWLERRPDRGVWAGLWSLPEFDSQRRFELAHAGWPGRAQWLPSFVHALTHFDWTLHPVRWTMPARTATARVSEVTAAWPAGRWFSLEDALVLGLPAPVRTLLRTPLPT
ncbi:MAG: A/G-specific adenine glycosylase [Burkholderiaceae bacterium]